MIYLLLAALVFVADYLLKKQAGKLLKDHTIREVAGDKILLRKVENKGFAGGLLKKDPKDVLCGSAAAVGATLVVFLGYLLNGAGVLQKLGSAIVFGGGLNNLAERRKKGSVTDYFSLNVKDEKIRKLVFNFSDVCIFLGTLLICLGEIVSFIKELKGKKK